MIFRKNGRITMHLHSSYSDGMHMPRELVARLKKAGVKAASLTDHNVTAGTPDFAYYARASGLDFITGVEITAYQDEQEFHVLGYGYDPDKWWDLQKEFMPYIRSYRRWIEAVIAKHNEIGTMRGVTSDMIRREMNAAGPHIGEAFIMLYRIRHYGLSVKEVLDEFCPGSPVYVPRDYSTCPTPVEAIRLIRSFGGKAVLAHPGAYEFSDYNRWIDHRSGVEEFIKTLKDHHLFGLEVYHPSHNREDIVFFNYLADRFDLLKTAGSDFHGATAPNRPVNIRGMSYADFRLFKQT